MQKQVNKYRGSLDSFVKKKKSLKLGKSISLKVLCLC